MAKPVVGRRPPKHQKIVPSAPTGGSWQSIPTGSHGEAHWKFSFKYFNQATYFGLSSTDSNWLVSFLARLQSLSNLTLDEVVQPGRTRSALRFHRIDWQHKNVPVSRQDFNWLPAEILNNEEDFPFIQISISKGRGRLVGFLLSDVFYVIVIDREHNLQPSQKTNYQVKHNSILESELDLLNHKIETIKGCKCNDPDCMVRARLHEIDSCCIGSDIFVICLEADYAESLLCTVNEKRRCIKEILELGIASLG